MHGDVHSGCCFKLCLPTSVEDLEEKHTYYDILTFWLWLVENPFFEPAQGFVD